MPEIALTKGFVTTVDESDYEMLGAYRWHAAISGGRYYEAPCNGNLDEANTPHTAFLDIAGKRAKSRLIPTGHILIHVEGWVEKE